MIGDEITEEVISRIPYDPYSVIANSLSNVEDAEPAPDTPTPEVPVANASGTVEPKEEGVKTGEQNVEDFFSKVAVNDEWRPINVAEEELPQWYENKYKQLLESVAGDQFKQTVLSFLQEDLLKEVENVEEFKRHYLNFQTNPALYAAQYFPESLAKIGVEPVLSKEQIYQAVELEMAKEFGDNYQRMIDPAEAFKLGTYSYSILEKQRELLNRVTAKNEENLVKYNEFMASKPASSSEAQPIDPNALETFAKEEFSKFQRKFGTEKEFVNFVQESYNKNWLPTTEELWTLKNLDKILRDEYEKGIADGNKKQASDIRKQYGIEKPEVVRQVKSAEKETNYEKIHRAIYDPYEAINKSILGEN
jgi:hypothetical protein